MLPDGNQGCLTPLRPRRKTLSGQQNMIVVIDNYDSFTFNLVHYLGGLGADVVVHRNDKISADAVLALGAGRLLLATGMVDELVETSLARVPFTQLSNLTGTPSMSVPLHWAAVEQGGPELPFGAQFVAPFGDEATLLQLAAELEQAVPWGDRRSPLA